MVKRPSPKLLTVGRIADIVGTSAHRVQYVLKTRQDIRPTAYAGQTRLFDNFALARIREEINDIDRHRAEQIGGIIRNAAQAGLSVTTADKMLEEGDKNE